MSTRARPSSALRRGRLVRLVRLTPSILVIQVMLGILVMLAIGAVGTGCRRHRDAQSPAGRENLVAALDSPDPGRRKDAAKDLRDDDGPPMSAVPALLAAAQRETDPDAREELLITLGASGVAGAKPLLDEGQQDREKAVRKGAARGLELWAKKNGALTPKQLELIARLRSPEWKERRNAASELAEDGGPPRESFGPLLDASHVEHHPEVLGAILVALGKSGVPEAQPVIDANVSAGDMDVRRYARKAQKLWLTKNGTVVRKDVESATTAAPVAGAAPAPAAPDGCDQFKAICATDPFDEARCKSDMTLLSHKQKLGWADCLNSSPEPCQKAHESCMAKARTAPRE